MIRGDERFYSESVLAYYAAKASSCHEFSGYGSGSNEDTELADYLQRVFAGKRVLETACGTGYWTGKVARTACEITGTDASEEMLLEARRYNSELSNAMFIRSDAYDLNRIPSGFNGAFSVLWWCHIPLGRIRLFLQSIHSKLLPGSRVVHVCQLHDSDYMKHQTDSNGNKLTYRKTGGRLFKIVKNIPDEDFLRGILKDHADNIEYKKSDSWWWMVSYTVK